MKKSLLENFIFCAVNNTIKALSFSLASSQLSKEWILYGFYCTSAVLKICEYPKNVCGYYQIRSQYLQGHYIVFGIYSL